MSSRFHNHLSVRIAVILFFVGYFYSGIVLFNDYGVSWDEGTERNTGLVNTKFVIDMLGLHDLLCSNGCESDTAESLRTYYDKVYSGWFQLLANSVEGTLQFNTLYHSILIRHFMSYLFFFIGSIFLYRTIVLLFNDRLIAFFCLALFVLQPRFFAEQFYNVKDLTFLALISMASYFILVFIKTPNKNTAVLAGLLTGWTIATRVLGILLLAEVLVIFLLDKFFIKEKNPRHNTMIGFYVVSSLLTTFILWPYLWINPFGNFYEAFARMSNFDWNGVVLLNGVSFPANNLPWYYLINWIGISTPELVLFLMTGAVLLFLFKIIRPEKLEAKYLSLRLDLIYFGVFLIPLLMVIVLNSTVYDGWRHVYFIAAGGFVAIAWFLNQIKLFIETKLNNKKAFGISLLFLLVLQGGICLRFIIETHPYQNVYFNSLAKKELRKNYEMDYWGLSYREGLEYIGSTDERDTILVALLGHPIHADFAILPEAKKILWIEDKKNADYFLTTYRGHPAEYEEFKGKEVYTVFVKHEKILSVFKLK